MTGRRRGGEGRDWRTTGWRGRQKTHTTSKFYASNQPNARADEKAGKMSDFCGIFELFVQTILPPNIPYRMPALTLSPAWNALAEHYRSVVGLHMRDLFANDPPRFTKLSVAFSGSAGSDILLDYSKNRITEETM